MILNVTVENGDGRTDREQTHGSMWSGIYPHAFELLAPTDSAQHGKQSAGYFTASFSANYTCRCCTAA
jgi:hypothetical protein